MIYDLFRRGHYGGGSEKRKRILIRVIKDNEK
jgi:hypothetical protein